MVTSLHSRSWCCWKDIGWTSIRMSVHLLVTVRSATNIIFLSIHWFYKRSFAYNLETIVSINDLLLIILRFFCVLITWDWKNLFYPLIADDEYTRHDNVSLLLPRYNWISFFYTCFGDSFYHFSGKIFKNILKCFWKRMYPSNRESLVKHSSHLYCSIL